MQRLHLLGLNHTTAPIELREKLAFTRAKQQAAIEQLHQRFPDCEVVLLSTCNRVELYTSRPVHGHPRADELVRFLADFHSHPADAFRGHLYEKSGRDAVEHLFNVASSLDSMVLGETQILGQVREAYELSSGLGVAAAALHPLFQRAISVSRQVMHTTTLAEGRTSVASVAVDYARQIFDHFHDKTVLCIGAGKMAALVLQSFKALSPGELLVCNRDPTRATALANRFGGAGVAFEKLATHLVAADIVVSSTGSEHPIITRALFDSILRQRRYRPLFMIDIALPRDIEPAVGKIENVYLYNLDDLQTVVSRTHAQRQDAVTAARQIVMQHVEDFLASQRTRELGPTIDALYKRYHRLASDELQRTLGKIPDLSQPQREQLEELTRRIVNKLLHDPVAALRHSVDEHGNGAQYLHAMEKLFALDPHPQTPPRPDGDRDA